MKKDSCVRSNNFSLGSSQIKVSIKMALDSNLEGIKARDYPKLSLFKIRMMRTIRKKLRRPIISIPIHMSRKIKIIMMNMITTMTKNKRIMRIEVIIDIVREHRTARCKTYTARPSTELFSQITKPDTGYLTMMMRRIRK